MQTLGRLAQKGMRVKNKKKQKTSAKSEDGRKQYMIRHHFASLNVMKPDV